MRRGDRSGCNSLLPRLPRYCCTKSSVDPDLQSPPWNSFDCATRQSFCHSRGQWIVAMIETVTALLGLVSAGIFLAHAFEGFRSRARSQLRQQNVLHSEIFNKF